MHLLWTICFICGDVIQILKTLKLHFFNILNKTKTTLAKPSIKSLNIHSSNSCAFHFVEIFHFEEIQSAFGLCLQNTMGFLK